MPRPTKLQLEERARALEGAYDRMRASHLDLIRFAEMMQAQGITVPDLAWSRRIDEDTQKIRWSAP